jgi:hypothetical protein
MRPLSWLALTFLVGVSVASPAWARVATIETTAPLQDHAEQSIKTAFEEAVETAVRGAVAMGLSWVKLGRTQVLENMVTVQILATDTDPQGEEGSRPDGESGARPAHPARPDL